VPVLFTRLSARAALGLALYRLTSYLIGSSFHQRFINLIDARGDRLMPVGVRFLSRVRDRFLSDSAGLKELQCEVAGVRARLEELARRLRRCARPARSGLPRRRCRGDAAAGDRGVMTRPSRAAVRFVVHVPYRLDYVELKRFCLLAHQLGEVSGREADEALRSGPEPENKS